MHGYEFIIDAEFEELPLEPEQKAAIEQEYSMVCFAINLFLLSATVWLLWVNFF